jgi:hypothetical protein
MDGDFISHVLIEEDRITIRVDHHESRRPDRRRLDAGRAALKRARVGELRQRVARAVPAGVEGQDVALERALK